MRGWYGLSLRAHPVVRDVAVVERMLAVGELARHRGAQDQFGGADLDRVAEAPDRFAVLQMRGDQVPHRVARRPPSAAGPSPRPRSGDSGVWLVCFRLLPPSSGNSAVILHAGGVVQRVVERPDRHVGHAHVEDAVRPLPADVIGEIDDRAGAHRLVAGVARLAADHRVLQIDQAEELDLVAQRRRGSPRRRRGRGTGRRTAASRRSSSRSCARAAAPRACRPRGSAPCPRCHTTGP